jgi:chemotaxis protein methyltransferase CheR
MPQTELRKISKAILEKTGLHFAEDKFSIFQTKIDNRIRELKITDYKDYLNYLVLDNDNSEFNKLVNGLTINETFFFRHPEHFNALQKIVLPELCKNNKTNKLRIWSAACANGCEVYSIAIIIKEMSGYLLSSGIREVEIIGTDISSEMIEFAKKGIYNKRCVTAEMGTEYLNKYFHKIDERSYRLDDSIKKMVTFRILNLKDYIYPKEIDIIFFRNVMYYFDDDNQYQIAVKIHNSLKKCGTLFLGGTEVNKYFEFFETMHIDNAMYYSKWSTDKKNHKNSNYGRTFSFESELPKIKYSKNTNEIIFEGVFSENCNIERIKNDIMYYAGLSNFKVTKKIILNFENICWISNYILGEIKSIIKFYKNKMQQIKIIINVGKDIDLFTWLKKAKFEEIAEIKLLSEQNHRNNQFENKPVIVKKCINKNQNVLNVHKVNKCDTTELDIIKFKLYETLKNNEKMVIDISNAENVSIELFDIVNKAIKATEIKNLVTIIE